MLSIHSYHSDHKLLPTRGASFSIDTVPPDDIIEALTKDCNHWKIRSISATEDDPTVIITKNQEKLRENAKKMNTPTDSHSKHGISVLAKNEIDNDAVSSKLASSVLESIKTNRKINCDAILSKMKVPSYVLPRLTLSGHGFIPDGHLIYHPRTIDQVIQHQQQHQSLTTNDDIANGFLESEQVNTGGRVYSLNELEIIADTDDYDISGYNYDIKEDDDETMDDLHTVKNQDANMIFEIDIHATAGKASKSSVSIPSNEDEDEWIVDSLANSFEINDQSLPKAAAHAQEWAITTLLPESVFYSHLPKLALMYPFELDVFQKQAICRLERKDSVFVAAHTSAGKTVVAEYAIALAKTHATRTIYTSPIKALSNQKYRDFSEKFSSADVGIITGDISVNPDASCLVMTTEILRSMLYRGSDKIKDVEFVIFDEIHYINDAERGVVWEEVIIMLPDYVTFIFLSATTPNTVEFCNWIGRMKKRKIYIVSTNKRPVPLQHFMIHNDEVYKLMHADKSSISIAVAAAVKHEKDKLKPKQKTAENAMIAMQRQQEKSANAARNAGVNTNKFQSNNSNNQVKTAKTVIASKDVAGSKSDWLSLLKLLQHGGREASGLNAVDFGVGLVKSVKSKKARMEKSFMEGYSKLPKEMRDNVTRREYESMQIRGSEDEVESTDNMGLLPVVVFSFSKNKCDDISEYFRGVDLLSAREKGKVFQLMKRIYHNLTPIDAQLPQVKRLYEMACRGIGVHHSGVLPILKEFTEILFSQSIIKVLIATETFAMGVNMPARSVVFNGYRKHDGRSFRNLLPGEYSQMSGRAGRRGMDKVGTVLLAAWTEIPPEMELKQLMTGTATKLSSQFRLSYNMILNLLRLNDLSVEDMIKRSFSEFHSQRALESNSLMKKLKLCKKLLLALETKKVNYDIELTEYIKSVVACRTHLLTQLNKISETKLTEILLPLCLGRIAYVCTKKMRFPCLAVIIDELGILTCNASSSRICTSQALDVKQGSSRNVNIKDLQLHVLIMYPDGYICDDSMNSDGNYDKKVGIDGKCYDCKICRGVGTLECKQSSAVNRRIYQVESITVNDICILTKSKVQQCAVAQQSISDSSTYPLLLEEMIQICNDNTGGLDSFDFNREFKLNTSDSVEVQLLINHNIKRFYTNRYHNDVDSLYEEFNLELHVQHLRYRIDVLQYYVSSNSLALFPDFQHRLNVLKLMDYIDCKDETVTLKGGVACEMNTCDELLATETIFQNILEPLNPPELAGLLSAFIFQENIPQDMIPTLTSRMEVAKESLLQVQYDLLEIQSNQGVQFNPDLQSKLCWGISAVVYEWARGTSFSDITKMTSIHEGSIVRCITRLDELLKDVRNAARVIGNPTLYRKCEAASTLIKRNIIFSNSLYI